MRLTADEPARIKGYGFLFVVRKDSPYADIAMDFIASQTYKTGEERRTSPNGCIFAPIPSIQPTLIRSRRNCAHSSHWGK